MWAAFEKPLARFRELETQLADPAVVTDHQRYAAVAKEHGALAKTVRPYLEYLRLSDEAATARSMLEAEAAPEMRAYAEEESKALDARVAELRGRLEDLLLVEPGEDFDSII